MVRVGLEQRCRVVGIIFQVNAIVRIIQRLLVLHEPVCEVLSLPELQGSTLISCHGITKSCGIYAFHSKKRRTVSASALGHQDQPPTTHVCHAKPDTWRLHARLPCHPAAHTCRRCGGVALMLWPKLCRRFVCLLQSKSRPGVNTLW